MTLRLTHPRYHLSKTYLVDIDRPLTLNHQNQIASGLFIDNQKTLPLKIVANHGSGTNFIITLHQGLNRQIRRMFEQLGYVVLRLHRIAVGPISLGDLKPGECRPLTSLELKSLQK